MENDSFIYGALRTPIGSFNGKLSFIPATGLASAIIPAVLQQAGVNPEGIEEVLLGNVISAGIGQAPARQAALQADLPESIPATTVNKICGSGMKTVMMADQTIRLNQAKFILTGGMESMSQAPFLLSKARQGLKLGNQEIVDSLLHDGLQDAKQNSYMGELSEKLAQEYCISRESQDAYAMTSYLRAREAQDNGIFGNEIEPITVNIKGKSFLVEQDEQPYADEIEKLAFLSPAFDRKGGTITKGNGAKISDGAAILVVGRESENLKPIARIVGYATHAQSPETFPLAPIGAIQKVLEICGLKIQDIDLFEINEAFAAMSLIINQKLDLDSEKVNVLGGSIALGHPIGCTGARILVTLINALKVKGLRKGLASLCIGGGEATAMVIEMV